MIVIMRNLVISKKVIHSRLAEICKWFLSYLDYVHTSLKPFVDILSRFVQRTQINKQEDILARSGLRLFSSRRNYFKALFFRSQYDVIWRNLNYQMFIQSMQFDTQKHCQIFLFLFFVSRTKFQTFYTSQIPTIKTML